MQEKTEVFFTDGSISKITITKFGRDPKVSPTIEVIEEPKETIPKYLVGSKLLYEGNQYLMSQKTEMLVDVSGWKHNGLFVLERLEPVKLDESTTTYAKSNLLSTRDALFEMHRRGYLLVSILHSHPGYGPGSVSPSSTDINNQKKLEKVGYKCISGIYSRDGYIRFFTLNNPFEIVIKGQGVECVEENLFRLTEA
jgi:hypothetical protein